MDVGSVDSFFSSFSSTSFSFSSFICLLHFFHFANCSWKVALSAVLPGHRTELKYRLSHRTPQICQRIYPSSDYTLHSTVYIFKNLQKISETHFFGGQKNGDKISAENPRCKMTKLRYDPQCELQFVQSYSRQLPWQLGCSFERFCLEQRHRLLSKYDVSIEARGCRWRVKKAGNISDRQFIEQVVWSILVSMMTISST